MLFPWDHVRASVTSITPTSFPTCASLHEQDFVSTEGHPCHANAMQNEKLPVCQARAVFVRETSTKGLVSLGAFSSSHSFAMHRHNDMSMQLSVS
mmetsp:Transcript_4860/g.31082  ORF Transcript_4860/g.31082 Transcript_4860/m.31082 type:complete len:95 (+) Transcript_4860:486-770(+)